MKTANYNHIRRHTQRGFWASLLAGALMLGMSSMTQAAPLNLVLNDYPDIMSGFINVTYDESTDHLSADGWALTLDDDGIGAPWDITGGIYDLDATIDGSGILSPAGTISIGGTIGGLGFNSGTLLTGSLTAFGFNDAGLDPLEFLFTVTGGDAANLYGGIGFALGGIILNGTGIKNWASDYGGNYSAVSDVGTVPVPAALWLFGSGLIGLLGFGRNSRRKQHS